ncbi:DNA-directed RNA polymerase I subunit rpa49 [Hypsizygus marmoreus]|uniref:DNA-directed RNA polymerase I subunit rpa49 n=1 Tax=Hypsizygus marmoreus TaxID=39966 RepID=A0A369JR32_HYPMA|nr:DNA-directed RNA polymerase I subunit rpa49 [Hypsizygus marmoreus]
MSATKSGSKKRKRDVATSEGVTFELSASSSGSVGPVVVSFPALQAPPSTAFKCYAPKKSRTTTGKNEGKRNDKEDDVEEGITVVGETDDIEFISNEHESRKVANTGCRYLIAVHDKRTSKVRILPTPKSPHIMTRTVKALKSIPSSAPTAQQYQEARTNLGETFGTKKAKANIRAQERNRVDVSAMEGVMDHLQHGIDKGAVGLMTQDEAKEVADTNRPIPPFDTVATDPADIYPLHSIIPDVEWKALSISALEQAGGDQERKALLPFKWSDWINTHLKSQREDESQKSKKKNLKILLYVSAMLAFRQVLERNRKGIDKDQLSEKLPGVPPVVLDSLISRFTEAARGSSNLAATSATQTKLLTHIFALCLKVDNFATDTGVLAHDLGMTVPKVNGLFKTLGCKITILGERERTRLGLPDSTAQVKRAVLNAPVVFPKPRTMNNRRK